jgi:IS1 family transposase
MRLSARVGRGCAELHDRLVTGVRPTRLELDELWGYVGKKQRRVTKTDSRDLGDQYTFIALGSVSRAIISYRTGKRSGETTDDFIRDLRERVIGSPEISADGFRHYPPAIRSAFGNRIAFGQINKTYSVTHLAVKEAARRYSPAQVVAVAREVVSGLPAEISTSYVERSHLSLRMSCRRFARLTNAFSKTFTNHTAAVSLYVMFYNFCRPHESLRETPAMALGISDHAWSLGELIDAALNVADDDKPKPPKPELRVIQGGKE